MTEQAVHMIEECTADDVLVKWSYAGDSVEMDGGGDGGDSDDGRGEEDD